MNPSDFEKHFSINMSMDIDGIYSSTLVDSSQEAELKMRAAVATAAPKNYLDEIAFHHSVPVMDQEVQYFLKSIPENGKVIDIGGCWGWHWRNISKSRPDVTVVIVDFVKENLKIAREILHRQMECGQVHLVCGNGLCLPFKDSTFDGYWSVQTLQHIENFDGAVREASRVLKTGSVFTSYSLNNQSPYRVLLPLLGRRYHVKGTIPGRYFLERGSQEQANHLTRYFSTVQPPRYTEVLFNPDFGMQRSGKQDSLLGKLDSAFSGRSFISRMFGRQIAYVATK